MTIRDPLDALNTIMCRYESDTGKDADTYMEHDYWVVRLGLGRSLHPLWHPVSQPPTEEDALGGLVMISDGVIANACPPSIVRILQDESLKWARIRDVVLLPEKLF